MPLHKYGDNLLVDEGKLSYFIKEQPFLEKFVQAYQFINNDHGLIGKDLINLIRMAVTNDGVLSKIDVSNLH